jgi:hypothetical protein
MFFMNFALACEVVIAFKTLAYREALRKRDLGGGDPVIAAQEGS